MEGSVKKGREWEQKEEMVEEMKGKKENNKVGLEKY
jgi:hypothetical protein